MPAFDGQRGTNEHYLLSRFFKASPRRPVPRMIRQNTERRSRSIDAWIRTPCHLSPSLLRSWVRKPGNINPPPLFLLENPFFSSWIHSEYHFPFTDTEFASRAASEASGDQDPAAQLEEYRQLQSASAAGGSGSAGQQSGRQLAPTSFEGSQRRPRRNIQAEALDVLFSHYVDLVGFGFP
eukprot:gene11419-17792_t